jgi:hypothetical protein
MRGGEKKMSRISLLIYTMNIAAKTNGGSIKVSSEWLTALSDCINSELELTKAIAAKSVEQPANGSVAGGQSGTNTGSPKLPPFGEVLYMAIKADRGEITFEREADIVRKAYDFIERQLRAGA